MTGFHSITQQFKAHSSYRVKTAILSTEQNDGIILQGRQKRKLDVADAAVVAVIRNEDSYSKQSLTSKVSIATFPKQRTEQIKFLRGTATFCCRANWPILFA